MQTENPRLRSEDDIAYDIDKICRVCLQEKAELCLIFENTLVEVYNECTNMSIAQMMSECTKYKVERFDEMPDKICKECIEKARIAFSFKRQTERSYQLLVSQLNCVAVVKGDPALQKHNENLTRVRHRGVQTDLNPIKIAPSNVDVYDVEESCKVCGEKYQNMRLLRAHMMLEHPLYDKQCPICQKNFSRKEHKLRHIRLVHKQERGQKDYVNTSRKNSFPCLYCKQDFTLEVNLRHHIASHHKKEKSKNIKPFMEEPEIELAIKSVKCKDIVNTKHGLIDYADESDMENDDVEKMNPIEFCETDNKDLEKEKSKLLKSLWEITDSATIVKVEQEQSETWHNELDIDDNSNDEGKITPKIEIEMGEYKADADSQCDYNDEHFDNNDDSDDQDGLNTNIQIKQELPSAKFIKKKTSIIYDLESDDIEQHSSTSKTTRKRQRESDKDNSCPECHRSFSRHCHLRRHMLSHLGEKAYACSQCDKRFARSDHLKVHINNVHGTKEYKCDKCNIVFDKREELAKHNEQQHEDDLNALRIHSCEYCNKKFTSKNYLRKHILLHTERLFACKFCDETFKDRKMFREHEKTHKSEIRNFLCSICGESFQRNDYLRVHMRRHTGEKPYKCQFCSKGFPRATDLKIHERYHTGHKPNLCTLCGKGFHRAYNLTIHMRTHTGEKPFKCDQCPKSFAQSNDLKSHVRRHTGERYRCKDCDASFLQLYGLRQHALSTHGVTIQSNTGRLQKFLGQSLNVIDSAARTSELQTPLDIHDIQQPLLITQDLAGQFQ